MRRSVFERASRACSHCGRGPNSKTGQWTFLTHSLQPASQPASRPASQSTRQPAATLQNNAPNNAHNRLEPSLDWRGHAGVAHTRGGANSRRKPFVASGRPLAKQMSNALRQSETEPTTVAEEEEQEEQDGEEEEEEAAATTTRLVRQNRTRRATARRRSTGSLALLITGD